MIREFSEDARTRLNRLSGKRDVKSLVEIQKIYTGITEEVIDNKSRLYGSTEEDGESLMAEKAKEVCIQVAHMALLEYNDKDGDLYDYLRWFISSAANMTAVEFMKGFKKDTLSDCAMSFFKKVTMAFESKGKAGLAYWGIAPVEKMIMKSAYIYREYGF